MGFRSTKTLFETFYALILIQTLVTSSFGFFSHIGKDLGSAVKLRNKYYINCNDPQNYGNLSLSYKIISTL